MITTNLIMTGFIIVLALAVIKITDYFIKKIGATKNIIPKRIYYVSKVLHFLITLFTMLALAVIWNVQLGGVMVFASSIFAVIGVALFAQWSILSNLTSSVIIFFTFPARVGDKIKVIDGDNSLEGEIIEISLFQIEIRDDEGNTVLYPNNLFIQKPIMKIKKEKSGTQKVKKDLQIESD